MSSVKKSRPGSRVSEFRTRVGSAKPSHHTPPTPSSRKPLDRPVLRWGLRYAWSFIIVVLTIFGGWVGYAQVRPNLSIERGERLEQNNPYSELSTIVNEGYIEATDIRADCTVSAHFGGLHVADSHFVNDVEPDQLQHGKYTTAPCFHAISNYGTLAAGTLSIDVMYRWLKWMKSHQTFRFELERDRSGGGVKWRTAK